MRPYVMVLEPAQNNNPRAIGPEYIATSIRPMRWWELLIYKIRRPHANPVPVPSDEPSLGIETTSAVYRVLTDQLKLQPDTDGSVVFIAPPQNIAGPLEDLVI